MKKTKRGFANVGFVFFIFVFIIIAVLSIEVYNIYTMKEYIDNEMSRACNIATDIAMIDEYRWMHISMMDTAAAETEFNKYLHDDMGLNANNEKIVDGKLKYVLVIDKRTASASPAAYEVKGRILFRPILMGNIYPGMVEIPFKEKSRNQRFE